MASYLKFSLIGNPGKLKRFNVIWATINVGPNDHLTVTETGNDDSIKSNVRDHLTIEVNIT